MSRATKPICYSYARFSTKPQEHGASLARQSEKSEKWVRDHGYSLDNSLRLQDLGKSAFKGQHIGPTGALGGFLEAVKAGKVKSGSILVCESLDRLSRAEITDALEQFLAILRAGIKIVTLADCQEYTRESVNGNLGNIVTSLVIMSRSHEESLTKSRHIADAWQRMRERAKDEKISKRVSAWLKLSKDGKRFELVPDHAAIIKRIFQMTKDGHGVTAVVRTLNKEGVRNWGRNPVFTHGGVTEVLRSRVVLGEFQPNKRVNGKYVPATEPIKGYFPRVVSDELFYAAWKSRLGRKRGGGRIGKVLNWVFGRISKCGYCGASMIFVNRTVNSQRTYIVCSASKRSSSDCPCFGYPYRDFERHALIYLKELNLDAIRDTSVREKFAEKVIVLEGQLERVNQRIANITEAIADGDAPRALIETLKKLEAEQVKVERDVKSAQQQMAMVEPERLTEVKGVIDDMGRYKGDELFGYRMRLREAIYRLVDRIDVFPGGVARKEEGEVLDRRKRCFVVRMRSDIAVQHARLVLPNRDDPEHGATAVEALGVKNPKIKVMKL